MRLTIKKLRQIIKEEIGRNLQTNPQLAKPGDQEINTTPDASISIISVSEDGVLEDRWQATVETPNKTYRQTWPTEGEANFWAKEQLHKYQRKKFSGKEKAK